MGKISPKFENYKNEKHNLLYLELNLLFSIIAFPYASKKFTKIQNN